MTFRVLLSFHYYRQDIAALFERLFTPPYPPAFADSGAFSAATQGAVIAIEDYATWLHQNEAMFDAYANFDVIGNAEATWENQLWLEARGLKPLPVFHIGSDFAWLQRYLDRGDRYIAIGGMVGRPLPAVMAWSIKAHQLAKEAGAVLHGFGLTTWRAVLALPWYSVDSSSWGAGYRYGQIRVFDPKRLVWVSFTLGDKAAFKHGQLLRSYGYEPAEFANRTIDRKGLATLSALSWEQAEAALRKRHGLVYLPGSEPGLRTYLVDASAGNLAAANEGLKVYHADTSTKSLRVAQAGLQERSTA